MKGDKIMPKTEKIVLDEYGEYLCMEKGKFVIRDKQRNVKAEYPLFESDIGEVILKSGNCITVGTLASLGFWEIETLILTRRGKPVAYLRSTEYDSHALTRLAQYQAYLGEKGIQIAKQIILTKLLTQNMVLQKYGLRPHLPYDKRHRPFQETINSINSNNLKAVRRQLIAIEGRLTRRYYENIFMLLPEKLRIQNRKGKNAYDGVNNTLSLLYTFLQWKCHSSLVKAKLEPYLGFVHSLQVGKPSLVLDLMELYRHSIVDSFFIEYSQNLKIKDFTTKFESISKKRKGKREYLNNSKTNELMKDFYSYLEREVEIPRIRTTKRQTIETLINEEAYLLASYIRGEKAEWKPRII